LKRLYFFFWVVVASLSGGISIVGAARAQEQVWVQIEARPTLEQAEVRARTYAEAFANVNGFRMGSGWYAIALGPYSRAAAESELQVLRANRLVAQDSFIAFGDLYRQKFWPQDAANRTIEPVSVAPLGQQDGAQVPISQTLPEPETIVAPREETEREARQSERTLTERERKLLQEAMQWEGFYAAAIDGDFGAGTRRAMASYQASKGYDATGVLTTRQRDELVSSYRAVFAALGLEVVYDPIAGIEMLLPMGMIARDREDPPFVRYTSTTDKGIEVLLISQQGDQGTLSGLYDIMQTLEIVPPNGARSRSARSFVLSGQDNTRQSVTFAQLSDGHVKGYTLVWTPRDAALMERIEARMRASFRTVPEVVLPDLAGDGLDQQIDLMAGLRVRRPEISRSGVFVDGAGAVLTTTQIAGRCERLTLAQSYEAEIVARQDALGLVLLRPKERLAPVGVAAFGAALPRLKSDIAVAGFSYEDVLESPSVTFGTLADVRGLNGEESVRRLDVAALPGDAGGPVFDVTGAVIGLLQPRLDQGGRSLPQGVSFAVGVPGITTFLSGAGVVARSAPQDAVIAPEDLETLAGGMTVLVSCWN
jgi:S1-C subfamily serine protease